MTENQILEGYGYAKSVFAENGIDVDSAISRADRIPISMHCWQGDDFVGYDDCGDLSGGIAVTGNYPGRPRTVDELRSDILFARTLFPGRTKLNLHSNYAQKARRDLDRDAYTIREFQEWLDWAKANGFGLDFNTTFFSHPKLRANFSIASEDKGTRDFWIEHGKRCREIGAEFGRQLGEPCVVNFWMPDGFKDVPAERARYRRYMVDSLDEIFRDKISEDFEIDSIESKLFGFGIESYTVASHEFSLGYAITRDKTYCIDMGHFHPTEDISDKISSILLYLRHILLHTSRGVRWDSDHVVILDDPLRNVMREIISNGYDDRVFIAQDYFDGSINKIACWGIAMRNTRKAILMACLEPRENIDSAERSLDFTGRLIGQEENKNLPYSAIWDYYCLRSGVPVGLDWLSAVRKYEKDVLSER